MRTGLGSSAKAGKLHAYRCTRRRWSSLLERKLCQFCSTPFSSCPLPMHTQIQLSYIFSTAYHVIVETYAHKCADMCTGPGSTGRVRDTRCTAKILLILPLRSLFSFLPCFSFLSAVLFFFILKDNISNISLPCTGSIYNQIC